MMYMYIFDLFGYTLGLSLERVLYRTRNDSSHPTKYTGHLANKLSAFKRKSYPMEIPVIWASLSNQKVAPTVHATNICPYRYWEGHEGLTW